MSIGTFEGVCARQSWIWALALTFAMTVALRSGPLFAQSVSFFSQIDAQGDIEAASDCQRTFSSTLLAAGLVERPSAEIETILRDCVEDLSNPSFAQQCNLSAARGQVNYVFVVSAERDGEDWHLYVQALNPMMNGVVWQLDELTTARSALRAAREGCAFLAADFLYHQELVNTPPSRRNVSEGAELADAVSSGGGAMANQALVAVINVVSVTPSPAAFYVNGQEAGTAPGQFEVPSGVATSVELRSPGYEPWTQKVTVEAGAIERIDSVTLVALPATLQLTANVQSGEIVVDGAVVGSTVLHRVVTVEVPSGKREVSVRLDGFNEYRSLVDLAPGAIQSLTATLSATPEVHPSVSQPPIREQTGDQFLFNQDPISRPQPSSPSPPYGFVYIASGTFTMGSPNAEEGRDSDETQHPVTLTRGYYLQATEVTQGEWLRVMGNNPSDFLNCGSDCPVEMVSWLDAVDYANALSRLEGLNECYNGDGTIRGGGSIYDCDGYRLPTEAEWEYAARAGTSGSRYADLEELAWYSGNSGSATHCVAELQPNAWGLYDILGNVWEWTHDWYGPYNDAVTDPLGLASGSVRAVRGGGWGDGTAGLRSAVRGYDEPSLRDYTIGFRVARTAH